MSLSEKHTVYQRKPVRVHALRLDDHGNISIWNAEDGWLKRLIAEKRLQRGDPTWFIRQGTSYFAAAYPGDWVVLEDATDTVRVMRDEDFRAAFEDYVPPETEQE